MSDITLIDMLIGSWVLGMPFAARLEIKDIRRCGRLSIIGLIGSCILIAVWPACLSGYLVFDVLDKEAIIWRKKRIADCETMIALVQGKKEELLAQGKAEKRERLECWANEYPNETIFHLTRDKAIDHAAPGRLRTVRLVGPPTREEWEEAFEPVGWIKPDVLIAISVIAEMGCVTEETSDE